MPNLSINVEVILAARIEDAFADASRLAFALNFAYVTFEFNDRHCTAYPNGTGLEFVKDESLKKWRRGDLQVWYQDK